ncbi:MAG: hypothetical protein O3A46_15135, partial [Candidatus Poribacteria bacterium]|nr:hypothetical protein [Candidatus Poribacteria bacterium]
MQTGRKQPQPKQSVNGWPDLVTLWATVSDGRRRERILTRHYFLMTVVEQKSLDLYRRALDDPQTQWDCHLTAGFGHDL